jgi:hypothetical protein
MRRAELEAWVLEVLERVEQSKPVEDSRVELKREWPDPERAARRIAGHANAARGEPVLWIVGADEQAQCVTGAPREELANWWPRVEHCFESVAPSLTDLGVPHGDRVVVALLFDTTRAPYVIRVVGGTPEYEVPWREATRVRSARREDLLRLLLPATRAPGVEVLSARLTRGSRAAESTLLVTLYVVPRTRDRVCFPFHRSGARVWSRGSVVPATGIEMHPEQGKRGRALGAITGGPSELLVDGPGTVFFKATLPEWPAERTILHAALELGTTDELPPVRVEFELVPRGAEWSLGG